MFKTLYLQQSVLARSWLVTILLLLSPLATHAAPFLISISNPPPTVNIGAAGGSQFWPNAGFLDNDNNGTFSTGDVLISLRATVVSISAGDQVRLFTSGDNPVVRTNTGSFSAEIRWDVTDRISGLPVVGDPAFLITDIDGRNGNPIESVSALCEGLTSYTVNGNYIPGVNANNNAAAQTNIRVTETDGTILGEGTQNQSGNQQEGYMQFNWTGLDSWTVNYFSTNAGRWFVHDADGDVPFDATATFIDLIDLATIKTLTSPPAMPGDNVTFEIVLSNAGPGNATGANITDTLPTGLTLVSAIPTAGTINVAGQQINWTNVDLPVGADATLVITATVGAGVAPGTTLTNVTNTAQAAESKCSSRDILEAGFVVSEPPAPALSVDKSVSSATSFDSAGDTITYSYLVSNTGNVVIDSVMPTDVGPTFNTLPATNTLLGFTPASVSLTPGDSQVFTATYLLDQSDVDSMAAASNPLVAIENTAAATGMPVAGVLAIVAPSSVAVGFEPTPSLTVDKVVSAATAFTEAGDTITYEYTVTNTGNITIDSVMPTDTGPTFNGMAAAGALTAFTPLSVSLAPGVDQVFTASYVLQQADVDSAAASATPLTAINNTASATGDPIGTASLPVVPSDTAVTGIVPNPSMTIVKSVANIGSFSQVGDSINYQWQVTNNGNVSINSVAVTDAGPTFNGQAAAGNLSAISPASTSLMPGDSETFSANYVLQQLDIDNVSAAADPATAIDNTSTLSGVPVGGTFTPLNSNTIETGFNASSELTLTKAVSPATTGLGTNPSLTDVGDTLTYSFEVENSGDITVSSIVIDDSGPLFNGAIGTGSLSSINCASTSLLPSQTTTCSATYTLSQVDIDNAVIGGANAITNSATAMGAEPDGDSVTSAASNAATSIAPSSSINLVKTSGTPTISLGADGSLTDPGDTIDYQILVENTGNTSLSDVTISDSLTSVTCPALTSNGAAFINNTGALAPDDSVTCTASYVIEQADINSGQVTNTASVASTDPTAASVGATDDAIVGFTQKSSLVLSKVGGPPPTAIGEILTYTFTLENTGNVSLTAPEIVDAQCGAPATTLNRSIGYVSGDAGTVVEDTLDSDESWVFECTYTTVAGDFTGTGEITNTATATGTPPTGLPTPMSSASVLVQAQQEVGIALDKVAGVPNPSVVGSTTLVEEGDTVAYTFTVENTGNVELTAVAVSDPLITGQPSSNTINCPLTVLPAGASVICTATYILTQDDIDTGTRSNTATVTAMPSTAVPVVAPTATSGALVSIPASPSLTIAKSVSAIPASISATDTITYSYLVTNTGNVTINNVVPIDAGPTFNGVAGNATLIGFTPASAVLLPGADETFEATYAVTQSDLDNMAAAGAGAITAIDNTATASGDPENGPLAMVAPSTVETGVAPTASIALVKASTSPSSVIVGALIDYSFMVTNTGNVSVANPVINDAKCQPSTTLSAPDSGDGDNDGQLDVTETWLFTCSYALEQSDIDAGTVQNTAEATGQDPAGNDVSDTSGSVDNNDIPTDTTLTRTANWSLSKSTVSIPTRAGDTLDYTFVLTNLGNTSISSIVIDDPKCATPELLVSGDTNGDSILTPDEVWTYSCTSIAITQAEVDLQTVDNTATASGVAPVPLADAMGSASTPVVQQPSLMVIKSVAGVGPTTTLGTNTTETDSGDQISYEYRVSNTGNTTLDNISIADAGPQFNGVSGTNNPLAAANCGTPAPVLQPNDFVVCTVTYTLSQTDVDNAIAGGVDAVENTATASADDPSNVSVSSLSSTAVTNIDSASELSILKVGGTPTMTGPDGETVITDTITYSITATNEGNTTLNSVTISDDLAGVVVSCNDPTSLLNTFTNGSSSLAVGESVVCEAVYTIAQGDLNIGQVVNTARVTGVDPTSTTVSDANEVTTPITQNTSIELIKSASAVITPVVGEIVTYTFELTNTGNVSLTDPEVGDANCPSGSASPTLLGSGFIDGDINQDGVLDSGETFAYSCPYSIVQSDVDLGRVENTAIGTGTPPVLSGLPNPSSTANSIADIDQETGISLIKMAGVPSTNLGALISATDVGDTIDYSFEVANTGNVTLQNIIVADPLITAAPNSQTISCPFSALNSVAGATVAAPSSMVCTATYTLTQADVDAGSVMNESSAIGDPPITTPPSDKPEAMSSAMVGIIGLPEMTIDKTVAPISSTLSAGDNITYSYEIANIGNVTINSVEPLDVGPTFNGIAGTNGLSAFNTAPTQISLAPGQTQIFTATYEVSQLDLDRVNTAPDTLTAIDNTATADGEPENGNLLPVTPDSAETGVVTNPEITLTKTSVAPNPVVDGADITYSFVLENTGNVTVSDPEITDLQCAAPGTVLTFSSGYVSGDAGDVGVLNVGEQWTFVCTYPVTQADIDLGTVLNTATATGRAPSGTQVNDTSDSGNAGDETGADDDPTNTTLSRTSSWNVVKSTTSTPSSAGEMLNYQFVVTNTGNTSISNIVITDAKCSATPTLISGDLDGNDEQTPSEVWTYTCISVAVTQAEVDAGQVNNSVIVTGNPPTGLALPPATDGVSTLINRTASWNVAKATSSTPSNAGDTLSYTFVVTNTGNVSIGSVAVNDAKCAALPVLDGGDTNNDTRIDPVEIWSFSCTSIAVTQIEVDLGTVDNTVTVSGSPLSGAVPNATDSVSTAIAANAVLSLNKTASEPTIGFGNLTSVTDEDDTIRYTFEVMNDGNVTISDIVINDLGLTFNGVASTGSLSVISCPLTELAPGQVTNCTASYTLSLTDIDNAIEGGAGAAENSATASGNDPTNTAVVSNGSTANVTIPVGSSISIVKTAGAPTISNGSDIALTDEGDTISYTLSVTNDGNTTLTNVTVADTIATVTCPGFTNGSDSLAPNETLTCMAIYTLDRADLDAGEVVNIASVMGTDPAGTLLGDDDQVTTGFTQRASILLTKSATIPTNIPPQAGDSISYTFELENTGNVSLTSPRVQDPNCGADLTVADSGDTTNVGTLDTDEIWILSCSYITDIVDVNAGQVINTAVGSGVPPLGSGLPDPESTAGSLADLQQESSISLDKVAGLPTVTNGLLPTVADAGGATADTVSYTFNIVNTGNVTLTNIVLADPLITNGSLSCPFTALDPQSAATPSLPTEMTCTASYDITQADVDFGSISNEAEVTADAPTNVPAPMGRSSAMVTLPPAPTMSIVKSASAIPANVSDGTVITYTYVVTNTGNVSITGVLPIDAGPTFNGVTATNSLTAFVATTPSNTLPVDLAPADSQTFESTYTISQADLDNMAAAANPAAAIDNTATATGMPSNGTLASVPPSTVETGVAPTPALELIKTSVAPVGTPSVGALINYTFTLENIGNVSLSSPIVEDAQCQAPGAVLSFSNGYSSGDAGQVGILDVNETWVFNCSYALTQVDIDAGTVQNTALATAQDPAGSDVVDNSDSANAADLPGAGDDDPTNTPLLQSPSWMVDKSTSSTPATAGDTLLYNFVITNTGNVSISSIAVIDPKCATIPVLDGGDIDNNNVLSPTEIWSYSCTSIGVTQAEVNLGQVDNTVTVTGIPPIGTIPNAVGSDSTIIVAAAALTLNKTAATPTIGSGALSAATDVGDTIEFSFDVENTGNVTVNTLTIGDTGPEFDGQPGTGSFVAPTCPVTTLTPGQSTTCTAQYTLSQQDIDFAIAGGVNSVTNTANASGLTPASVAVDSPDSSAATSIVPMSQLDMVKTAGLPTIVDGSDIAITDPGDTITYTLAVQNTGNTTLDQVDVSDTIATVGACLPNTFVLGTSSLAPGDSLSCTAIYTLDQNDLDTGQVVNQASVEGVDPSLTPITDSDQINTGFNQRTSVALNKSLSTPLLNTPAQLNDIVNYIFTLDNTGNVSLADAQVEDLQCSTPDTVLTRATGYVSGDTNNDLALDASETWVFSCAHIVTQDDINAGGVVNTATATGTPPASTGFPPPTSIAGSIAELGQETGISLIKTGGQPTIVNGALSGVVDALDEITYSFAIENTGNVTLANIALTDPLIPTGVTNCIIRTIPVSTISTPTIPDLNAGEIVDCEAVYVLTQTDIDAGVRNNTASVTGMPPVTAPALPIPVGTGSAAVALPPSPSLTVVKSIDTAIPDPVAVNDVVIYSYEVSNSGNVTIDNVLPVDLGPTFNGVAGTNSLAAFTVAGPAVLPVSLAPGASQTFTASYALSQIDIDNMAASATPTTAVNNTATATGDPSNGSLLPVTESSVQTGVAGSPLITLTKASLAPASPAGVGSLVTYNFNLTNSGNVTVSNPTIDDPRCQIPGTTLSFGSGYVSGDADQVASLDVGETWVFSCSYALTQLDIDAGTVQNSAIASGQDPAGNGGFDDISDSTNAGDDTGGASDPTNTAIVRVPSWTVEKATVSVPRAAGDTLIYDFTVRNTGNVGISSVIVDDPKCATPETLISGDLDGNTILTPNEVWVYRCTSIAVLQSEIDAATVFNQVTATGNPPAGAPALMPAQDDLNTPVVASPSWTVVKSTTSVPTVAGDTLDYSFEVSNTGNISISNVAIVDAKCAGGPTLLASTDIGGDNIINPAGALNTPPAEVWTYTCTSIAVTQTEMDAGQVDNSVSLTGSVLSGSLPPAEDSISTFVTQTPSMSLVKDAGVGTVNADGSLSQPFNFVVKNVGNVSLSSITITDDLTAQFGACFVGVDESGAVSILDVAPANDSFNESSGGFPSIAAIDTLAVGDSLELTGFIARFDLNAAGCVFPNPALNLATADASSPAGPVSDGSDSGTDPDLATPNDPGTPTTFTLPTPNPELGVAKSAIIIAFNNDFTFDVEYAIQVQNTGNVDLQNLELFDDLVAQFGLAYVASPASDQSGGVIAAPQVSLINDAAPTNAVLPNVDVNYRADSGNLFSGVGDVLGVGDTLQVIFTVKVNPTAIQPLPDQFENTATVRATAPNGDTVEDLSNEGSDPTQGSGGPSSPTIVTLDDVANLPIELGLFSSTRLDKGAIRINWQTQTEVANLGFNIYAKVGDEWQKLNSAVVPAKGDSVQIVDYEFVVVTSSEQIALSDIDGKGKETLHGPFRVGQQYGKEPQRQSTDWTDAIERRKSKQQQRDLERRKQMLQRNKLRKALRSKVGS